MGVGVGVGCSHMHHDKEEEDEGNEVKMTMEQVPAPVQETLRREAHGATIRSVDQETSHGKVVYETDVMQGGKNWEIRVRPDGKLISKKIDNEEGEKSGKKDEDDEKEGKR